MSSTIGDDSRLNGRGSSSDSLPAKDGRVCRLLDECLSLSVLGDVGLFDMARKYLEFLKNSVYKVDEPQHTYGALGESSIPPERMPYLAGFQGMGEVVNGGVFVHDEKNHSEHVVCYGLLTIALSHCFFDIRLNYLASEKLAGRLEVLAMRAKEVFDRLKQQHLENMIHCRT